MKKLLLFILPVFFLISCGDEETPAPTIPPGELSESLQGKWTNNFVKREYYGDADTVVYADSINIQATFEFKGDQLLISIPGGGEPEAWTYALPDESDPNYITFTRNGMTTDYAILSISDTAMVWMDEEAYAGYPLSAPESQRKTSKVGKFTYRFVKAE